MVYGRPLIKRSTEKGSVTIWGSDSYPWKKKVEKTDIIAFQRVHPTSFLEKRENLEPLFNFCRVISEGFGRVFFCARREVNGWVRNLLELKAPDLSGRFLLFDETQEELVFQIREELGDESILLIFLGRKNDELDLLPLVFFFDEWKKAFVGRERGVFAEIARSMFCPFFPVRLEQGSFWHYSELVYVPLCCAGLKTGVHDLEEGFWWLQEVGKEAAIFCALAFHSFLKNGYQVFFVAEDSFSFNLANGFRSVFERISQGEYDLFLRVSDVQQFGETFLEAVDRNDKCLVFFIQRRNKNSRVDLQVKFPTEFRDSVFWETAFSPLHRKTYRRIKSALFDSLEELLSEKRIPCVYLSVEGELFFGAGVLGSFLQSLACYLGFLNGVNLLEEVYPSFLHRNFWQNLQSD